MRPGQNRTGSSEEYVALSLEKQKLLNRLGMTFDAEADKAWKGFERALYAVSWVQALKMAEQLTLLHKNKAVMKELIEVYFKLEDPAQAEDPKPTEEDQLQVQA